MKKETTYRLECNKHFWNFPSYEEATDAVKNQELCKNGFTVKEICATVDESGKIVSQTERLVQ